jgi:hypothetical protein
MSNLATNKVGTVGSVFQNGVRIESFHSIQLNISSNDIIKASDWDLKQFIRKLDPHCATPLFESIIKNNSKQLTFSLVYELLTSSNKLREKIDKLRNEAIVLGQLLYLNLKTDKELNCTVPQKAQQSIWLNNLPVRWFDLDIGGSEISKTHMLWAYLEEQFGTVKYMETSGHNTEKASLQMNVCVQFFSQSSSEKIVDLLGAGKCVCRREGSPTIFHLSVDYDTTGYFTDYQRAERAISRQKLHAAKKTESICIAESMIVLEKAGKFLERDDIVDGRTQSDSVEEGVSKLEKACLNVRFMMKQGASSMEKSTDIKQFCTNLKVACNVISDNIIRLEKILITENILKEDAMRREAERKV